MARPCKLTPARHNAIVRALATGCYRETAAHVAGIGVSTFYRWMEQGEADTEHDRASPHRELWEAIQRAEADAEQEALRIIREAAPQTWQAAAWLLERKSPQRWGRRDAMRVEHEGTIRAEVEVDVPETDEYRLRVAQIAAMALGVAMNGNGHKAH